MSNPADIVETERRFRGVRHVPDGLSAYEVMARGVKQFDPESNDEQLRREVDQVCQNLRYALQVAMPNGRPTVYCSTAKVLELVKARCLPEELARVNLLSEV